MNEEDDATIPATPTNQFEELTPDKDFEIFPSKKVKRKNPLHENIMQAAIRAATKGKAVSVKVSDLPPAKDDPNLTKVRSELRKGLIDCAEQYGKEQNSFFDLSDLVLSQDKQHIRVELKPRVKEGQ